jgi:Lhr-like helicase
MTEKDLLNERQRLLERLGELRFRASGRTTRLVDKYIQDLFNNPGEWVRVYDHWPKKNAASELARKIKKRMAVEHNLEVVTKSIPDGFALKIKNYKKPDFSKEIEECKSNIEAISDMLKFKKFRRIIDNIFY